MWRSPLRIPHFLGVHAMQAIPLVAWAVAGLQRRHAQWAVVLSAFGWTALTMLSMRLALSNRGLF